jgi:hypothetical protein
VRVTGSRHQQQQLTRYAFGRIRDRFDSRRYRALLMGLVFVGKENLAYAFSRCRDFACSQAYKSSRKWQGLAGALTVVLTARLAAAFHQLSIPK